MHVQPVLSCPSGKQVITLDCWQVVDGNFGIHTVIPKWPFSNSTDQYAPNVFPGSSKPAEVTMMTTL